MIIKATIFLFKAIPISFMMIIFPFPSRDYWYDKLEKITDKFYDEI